MARHSDGIIDRSKGKGADLASLGMMPNVQVTRDYSDMGVFQEMQVEKPVDTPLYVTDFTDQSFQVDTIQAVAQSSSIGKQGPDVKSNIAQCETAKSNYLQADVQIKENLTAACKDVLGVEEGNRFADHLIPDGAPTLFQAAATAADPSGVAGGIWSIVNAVQKQNDRFGTEDTRRILDQVLNKLQESSKQVQQQTVFDTKPTFKPPHPNLNFNNVQSAQQMLDFCKRDVTQDPMMQQLQESLDNARAYESNVAYNEAHEGEDFTADRLAVEIAAGNDQFIEKATGGNEAKAEALESCSAYAVDIVRGGLQQPPHIGLNLKDCINLENATVEAIKAASASADNINGAPMNMAQTNKLDAFLTRNMGGKAA